MAVEPRTVAAVSAETVYASKTLARFLDRVFARPNDAVVMDLGPVIGSNITFLGERVGCKIHVEDLYADIDRHVLHDKLDQLPLFIYRRFIDPPIRGAAMVAALKKAGGWPAVELAWSDPPLSTAQALRPAK